MARRALAVIIVGVVAALSAAPAQAKNDSVGTFTSNGGWYLINRLAQGSVADYAFAHGTTGDLPVTGDWNDDDIDGIGVYRPGASGSHWFLLNRAPKSGAAPASDIAVWNYGITGDRPFTGDFNADGKDDIGVYRPSSRTWYINLTPVHGENNPPSDIIISSWGASGDLPVAGDWNGDGKDGIGVFRPSTGAWYLLNTAVNGAVNPAIDSTVTGFGNTNHVPVAGNWDGVGGDGVGVLDVSTTAPGTWSFVNNVASSVNAPASNVAFGGWGQSGERAVAGDWDGRRPECSDGMDNDADGLVDLAGGDSSCASAYAHPEGVPPTNAIWDGDAEQAVETEWASWCIANGSTNDPNNPGPGVRIPSGATSDRIQPSPFAAQGTSSYRFEVRSNDYCGTSTPGSAVRSELGQDNPASLDENTRLTRLFYENQERWISWQVYLPRSFPSQTTYWQVIAQWHQSGGGGPPLSMQVTGGKFRLFTGQNNLASNTTAVELGDADGYGWPVKNGRWVKFTMHVKFSPDNRVGYVELFGDLPTQGLMTRLLDRTGASTMKVDAGGAALRTHSRIGIYRDARVASPSQLHFDGYAVATTRAEAEARAFRP